MKNKRIFLSSPHMSDEGYEQAFVKEAFDTNWVAPLGENVDKFEEELAELVGIDHASALSSGTAAIHLALKAAGVKKDDIVFCQTLTFSASANPITYENAIPVFIGSDEKTWNMDPIALKEAFKKHKAKAVILVHLYGQSADIDEIKRICDENGAILIEDAAESLGTTYKGKQTGTFGDFGIYSFNGNKIITTSGGGMLVSNNQEMIKKSRFWATQSRDQARHYEHSDIGYNYRMSNIVAGIGRGQLKILADRVEKKRDIFNLYKEGLKDIKEISFPNENAWEFSNHWLTPIVISGKVTPNELMDELEKNNIESRPIWKPMHLQPIFSEYDYVGNNVAETLFVNGVCLPSDSKMTVEQQKHVIEIIKRMFEK
ncbi:DegT/DnrJ/EryC1/StrS family aminotransferase [Vagococcus fluvialis]|uniref:DegT/DnrJ/EryC1/StrS family aminotransferase n=1 Tax=Vagococcus fluvialis TaxID=2738 RepID=UPI00288FDABE|nr:DegT/DnrJ/EryC1/StrS family aminotransferase [Vagococcus fluvialis]MDT2747780.1 aminotransferase class V-fold PLP-dependent enzyme [Vagococcus fluvialis]